MQVLITQARALGIDAIAITDAEPFSDQTRKLSDLQESGLYPEFVEQDLALRTEPQRLLPSVQSIVSVAIAYKTVEPTVQPGAGLLSRYAWGEDYHTVLTKRLEALAKWMQEHLGVKEYLIAVDTKPTIDRAIALRSGLVWLGQNCCVFHPDYGSWIFLGSILIDVDLTTKQSQPKPLRPACDQCNSACVTACPTNALYAPYQIDPYKCISYLTQMKGIIPRHLREKIGIKLWGCDTCQQACPANKQAVSSSHSCFQPLETASIPVIHLLNISKREFNRRFAATPFAWRGKGIIQRNAAIICGNLRLVEATSELHQALNDPKVYVRATAAWALGKIGTNTAHDILNKALEKEIEQTVITEILLALNT